MKLNHKIKFTLVQNNAKIYNKNYNFQNIKNLLSQNLNEQTDIIILPELFAVGWDCDTFNEQKEVGFQDETCLFLKEIAKEYHANVVGGSFVRVDEDGYLKNTMPVFNRNGELIDYYDKMHLYSYLGDKENKYIKNGDFLKLIKLDVCNIGVSICYDIRFPELFRSYSLSDNPPHLLVNLSAWPMTRALQYSQMAASRAIENQCYFLALSQCGEIIEGGGIYNSGGSCVYDSMGNLISKLDKNFGYIYFTLDTEGVDKTRLNYPNLKNAKVRDFGFNVKTIFAEGVKC